MWLFINILEAQITQLSCCPFTRAYLTRTLGSDRIAIPASSINVKLMKDYMERAV
jgi:hypothetical protein